MIARIEHEHVEREKLEQARQELLKRKQGLIAENKKRKNDLANLDQDLEKFIDVCSYACPSLLLMSLLIRFMTFRLLSRFKRSSRRNIRHCMWKYSSGGLAFLLLHRIGVTGHIPLFFCDFRVFRVDNDILSPFETISASGLSFKKVRLDASPELRAVEYKDSTKSIK